MELNFFPSREIQLYQIGLRTIPRTEIHISESKNSEFRPFNATELRTYLIKEDSHFAWDFLSVYFWPLRILNSRHIFVGLFLLCKRYHPFKQKLQLSSQQHQTNTQRLHCIAFPSHSFFTNTLSSWSYQSFVTLTLLPDCCL